MTSRRAALRMLIAWPAAFGAAALAACEGTVARLRGWRLVPLTTLDKVPPGSAYRMTAGSDPLILVNVEGEIRTFLAVCTHEGCPLGWNPQQHLIRCPCHGGAYDTSGKVVDGPPPRPLTRLETIVEDGTVLLVRRSERPAS